MTTTAQFSYWMRPSVTDVVANPRGAGISWRGAKVRQHGKQEDPL